MPRVEVDECGFDLKFIASNTQRPITTKMSMIGHDRKTLSVIYQQDVMQSAHTAELCYFTKSYVHHYYLLHAMNTKLHEWKCIHQLLIFWTNTDLYENHSVVFGNKWLFIVNWILCMAKLQAKLQN